MKQPLKEMLKKIGGGHLLNENKLQDYWDEITNEMDGKKIGKFWADVDMHTGGLSWGEPNSDFHIYATPAWEGKKYIEFEEGMTGKDLGKVPLKTTGDKKKDTKWYLATMKKHLPKIVKKFGQ